MLESISQLCAQLRAFRRQFAPLESVHVRLIMADLSIPQPFLQCSKKIFVSEILAPDRRKFLAGLDERSIQIEKSHQARPLS